MNPMSTATSPTSTVWVWPPGQSPASKTTTRWPHRSSSRAAVSPETPAPTTAIRAIASTTLAPGPWIMSSASDYPDHLRERVESYLEALRFSDEPATAGLEEAMRYSLLAGGK